MPVGATACRGEHYPHTFKPLELPPNVTRIANGIRLTRSLLSSTRVNMRRLSLLFCAIGLGSLLVPAGQPQHLPGLRAGADVIAGVLANVSDSAIASTIRGLEAFGNRSWSAPDRDSVAAWILRRYKDIGVSDVVLAPVQYGVTTQNNVVATIPGTTALGVEIIVGGHYDAVSVSPGADDNASGTAAAIEVARVLRLVDYKPRVTLRFIAFPAEEAGLVGSADYAAKAKAAGRQIVLMQNYDMIGYRDVSLPDWKVHIIWYAGSEAEASLDSLVMRTYTKLTPVLSTLYRSQSDSYSFWSQGYKTIFNIEYTLSPYYHTARDSSTAIDFTYAAEIVKSALAVLLTIDGAMTSAPGSVEDVPSGFALEQNYPNPFNPSTTIRYELPTRSHVMLSVFNTLGQQIAVLENGEHDAGYHEVRFDGSNLASGMYFYRLQAGMYVETKKFLLTR